MKVGKINNLILKEKILDNISYRNPEVLVHAGVGEDCAVVDFGEEVLVISSDPITGAVDKAGFLAVHINANDLAAAGASPLGMQVVLLFPNATEEFEIASLMEEIHQTAAEIGVEIIGGHTEIVDTVTRPMIVITGIGKAPADNYVTTGGARQGDDIIVTKSVGIEGTFILAVDFANHLQEEDVSFDCIEEAQSFSERISVLAEGLLAAEKGVNALHDITEGGLYGALEELSEAAGKGFILEVDEVPVAPETETICSALKLDPLGLLASGSMLITAPDGREIVDHLHKNNIEASIIGTITASDKFIKDKKELKRFEWAGKDELWAWLELCS